MPTVKKDQVAPSTLAADPVAGDAAAPAGGAAAPARGGAKTAAAATSKPGAAGSSAAAATAKRGAAGARPAAAKAKPGAAKGTAKPETAVKPVKGVAKPTAGAHRPAKGTAKTAGGTAKPVGDTVEPAAAAAETGPVPGPTAPAQTAAEPAEENPLHKKLRLRPEGTGAVIAPPEDDDNPLLPLPESFVVLTAPADLAAHEGRFDYIHVFARDKGDLVQSFALLRDKLTPGGSLWISWIKQSSRGGALAGDLNETIIRRIALTHAMVDVKVATLDRDWSALRLVHRKR